MVELGEGSGGSNVLVRESVLRASQIIHNRTCGSCLEFLRTASHTISFQTGSASEIGIIK